MDTMVLSLHTEETKDGVTKTVIDYELNGKKMSVTFDPTKENETDLAAHILAGFTVQDKPSYKPGDSVVIKDKDQRCRGLTGWAIANLTEHELVAFGAGLGMSVANGTKGTVVKVAKKNVIEKDKDIVAVQVLGASAPYIVLMNPEGIEAA